MQATNTRKQAWPVSATEAEFKVYSGNSPNQPSIGRCFARRRVAFVAGALAVLLATTAAQAGDAPRKVEEILVVRSLREVRIPAADVCRQMPAEFGATVEDTYSFQAVEVTNGRVTNANAGEIGRLRACYGKTAEPGVFGFFAIGELAGVPFKGLGDCRNTATDFPESNLISQRCYLRLSDLPKDYVGGVLTTNTVNSRRLVGLDSDPPGYTQPSIATVRLWRRPAD